MDWQGDEKATLTSAPSSHPKQHCVVSMRHEDVQCRLDNRAHDRANKFAQGWTRGTVAIGNQALGSRIVAGGWM
jgi:hypothetical protein